MAGKLGIAAVLAAMFLAFILVLAILTVGTEGPPSSGVGLPGVVCAPPGGAPGQPVAGFKGDQLANAAAIVAAGREMNVPDRGQVIAVATAMQESTLHNLANGDLDSIGLFQQRTSWGPTAVRMDPKGAAKLFYTRLLAIPGWQQLPLTVAAQRVQASALPDAYAKWETKAAQVVGGALGIVCQPGAGAPGQLPPADPLATQVIARAMSQLGVPYAWGGGNAAGPTQGISDHGGPADRAGDSAKVGFDCSGLMVYAFAAAGITVPHQTQAIWAQFQPAIRDRNLIQPGDMILLSGSGQDVGAIDHVGLYIGNDQVINAPQSGQTVRIIPNVWANPYWSAHFVGAVRATSRTAPQAT